AQSPYDPQSNREAYMRTLEIEDLRENPRNVMVQPLPEHPTRLLLLLAQIAATCCRQFADETVAELEASYGITESMHPEIAAAVKEWHRAHRKIGEICFALRDEFGIPVFDFCLSRDITWTRAIVRGSEKKS